MIRRRSICLLLIVLLSACRAAPPGPAEAQFAWTYADLRLLDSLDAPGPAQELVAVYLRADRRSLHIRLDLLEIASRPDSDLYLAIDTGASGSRALPIEAAADLEWDTLVMLPTAGPIRSLAPDGHTRGGLAIRMLRDPVLDTLTIHLNRLALPRSRAGLRIQVFLTQSGSARLADCSEPLWLEGAPPPPARVLFAFWNTFPAYTPALALRRWDGAHTGPLGGRHGLYNLLRAARNHQVPLVLLDLKTPASLAALDYAGGLDMVQSMSRQGLLILPDSVPDFPAGFPAWAFTRAAQDSRQMASVFGLASSPFLYLPQGIESLPAPVALPAATYAYRAVFTRQALPAAGDAIPTGVLQPLLLEAEPVTTSKSAAAQPLLDHLGQSVIPVPSSTQVDAASDAGPGLEMRRALVETALNAAPGGDIGRSPVLILGGDLPDSAWGNPPVARAVFAYLRGHPWIRFLSAHDLQAARPATPYPAAQRGRHGESKPANELLLQALQAAPDNPLSAAAWQALEALYSPVTPQPPDLAGLRQVYLGQVGVLLAAARWAENPAPAATCELDLDEDGRPECLLATAQIFAVFDARDGALAFAFARTASGPHQFIAPSAQFAAGLSDPSTWDLSRGLQADPAVIPGAFSGAGSFQPVVEADRLTFLSTDGSRDRAFYLTSQGIQVRFFSAGPHNFQIPLALDPWLRFSPGWGASYRGQATGQGYRWSISARPAVELSASGRVTFRTFVDTRRWMGAVEDPNFEFPPGHYLPFPLAVITVEAQGEIELQLQFTG